MTAKQLNSIESEWMRLSPTAGTDEKQRVFKLMESRPAYFLIKSEDNNFNISTQAGSYLIPECEASGLEVCKFYADKYRIKVTHSVYYDPSKNVWTDMEYLSSN